MNNSNQYNLHQGYKIDIFLVSLASMIAMSAQGVIRPILGIYVKEIMHAEYLLVSLIPAIFNAGKFLTELPVGKMMGLLSLKKMMICGLLLLGIFDILCGYVRDYNLFLCLRFLGGVSAAVFFAPATVYVLKRALPHRSGESIGFLFSSEVFGIAIGSAVSGLIYKYVGSNYPFVIKGVITILAVFFLLKINDIRETKRQSTEIQDSKKKNVFERLFYEAGFELINFNVLLLMLVGVLSFLLNAGLFVSFLGIFLKQGYKISEEQIGIVFTVMIISSGACGYLSGLLLRKMSGKLLLIIGLFVTGVGLFFITAFNSFYISFAGIIVTGAGQGFCRTLPTSLLGRLFSGDNLNKAIALNRLISDLGAILGPVLLGKIADNLGLSSTFLTCVGFSLILTILTLKAKPYNHKTLEYNHTSY